MSDSRRVPALLFVVAVVVGMLAKFWRAGDLWLEAGAFDGFVWLPLGLGAELLVAGVLAGLVALLLRVHVVVGKVAAVLLLLAEIAWLTLNDVSFRLSQIGITFQRIRGEEGVAIKDFNLMAMGDVLPALGFAALAVVCGVVLAAVTRNTTWLARVTQRVLVVATVCGAALTIADLAVFSDRNFGMADSPVLLVGRTWVRALFDRSEVNLPRTVATPRSKEERLALLKAQEPQPAAATPVRQKNTVKNGILFFSEGIARKHTGLEGQATTPNLLAAIKEYGAVDFTNYYTTYHKSIAAIFSMTCSDFPPPNAKNIMEVNPRIDCGSLPEVMVNNQVHPGLFHGGDFGFYDKLQLLGARGYEVQKDARAIAGNGLWESDWGVDDRAVVDTMLAWIDTIPVDERFFAVLIPITAHYPYEFPPDAARAFPGDDAKDRFYSAVHFLDEAYGRLIAGLKARGRLDDTAILYMADHGETVAERPRAQAGRRLAYEPSVHIPFVVVAPGVFSGHQQNARVGSHVDLLPTIVDLMGLAPDARNHGQSLVSSSYEPRRVFIGASNGPKYVGFVDGRQKFVVNRASGLRELYDLNTDPFEQHNIAGDFPEKADRLTSEALAFADGQLAHLKSAPKLPGDVDVQAGLLEFAEVRVVKADGTVVPCARDPESMGDAAVIDLKSYDKLPFRRTCPGEVRQPFLGTRAFKAGRTRDCVLVNVPDGGGATEIVLRGQPWLPFITRIRAGVQGSVIADDDEAVLTAFGDGKQGQEKPINKDNAFVRTTFPSSSKELVVRVSGKKPLLSPVCLTFTETAWRKAPATSPSAITAGPNGDQGAVGPDDPPEPTDDARGDQLDAEAQHDELHGRKPSPQER
jgi:hypothetical protein